MWFLILVVGIVIGVLIHSAWVSNELDGLRENSKQFLGLEGYSSYRGIGHYLLISVDGGVSWSLAESGYPGGRRICKVRGPVCEIYPGLLEHDRALRQLFGLVQQGTAVPWDSFCRQAEELLNDAGFCFVPETAHGCDRETMFEELAILMTDHRAILSEYRFGEMMKLLDQAGFILQDDALAESALRHYIEDNNQWPASRSLSCKMA
jgi:hypothetical protein